ncbi:MFS transporter [Terriglobus roseus]|uniref:Predicted arabinose efflux permease, MFS family n=1 Tax=Terriglobus roseus TaxID=392734 RepID=A0A1H4LWJ2_9BACT|nr:MFS transporter [Terriglobus roseus]SEB74645.1 Predicted arabinose efflux permease, MFS family [Terriglobus roseus]
MPNAAQSSDSSPRRPRRPLDSDGKEGAAFSSRNFRRYQMARLLVIVGAEAQSVAVAWQIYQITHSALFLGYTGLALFLPGIFFVLPAGHAADRYDRKTIIVSCYVLQAFCTALLLYLSLVGTRRVLWIYAILFCIGAGRAFSGPASSAIQPQLVPKGAFVNAMTWGSAIFQVANITGPAIGGLLFAIQFHGRMERWTGSPIVYALTLITMAVFSILVSTLRPRKETTEKKGFSFQTMMDGARYVGRAKLLLGSISLDMFAVLLGGAVSLMPIFAQDILHAGPRGLGILRGAPAIGALCTSITLARRPIRHHAGKLMLVAVGIFGVATIVFGLSKSLPLSLVALFFIGASDNISVIIRQTILQLGTPPEMRGRVSAINWLFLGASNEFGEFESGLTARWLGAVRAVVFGGIGSLVVTGLWSVFFPRLRKVDSLDAEALLAANTAYASSEPID